MSKFKAHQRTELAYLRPFEEGENLTEQGVSISQTEVYNGSPKIGDMIARNPDNEDDQWLVAKEYYEKNFIKINENADSEPTFGMKAVGMSFNPSKDSKVDRVKHLFAEIIDDNKQYHADIEKPTWMQNVLHTMAFNACIAAQMAVVKFLTWKE